MERYLILVMFSVSCCTEYYGVYPVSYESELVKYEGRKNSKDTYLRNEEYGSKEISYDDDLARINDDYEKYIGEKNTNNEFGRNIDRRRQRKLSNEELDKIFGYTGPTANDEPENLMRPCAFDDWECIRNFFASNGKCQPAYGPVPDPLYQDVYSVFFPSANLTAALPGLQIRGLSSAKITEFYLNKKSGNLVFAFDLQNFNVFVPRAYLRYRRTAKESIILAGLGTINFQSATFTVVIPKVPDLRLDQADSHVYIPDGMAPNFLSPEIAASPDPDVVTGVAALRGPLPLSIQEGVFFEAQLLSALYIQKNICDFGLKLISV